MTDLPVSKPKTKVDKVVKSGAGASKEKGDLGGKQEVTPMTEYTRKVDLEPEVESWLEKLEKEDTSLSKPVVDPSDDDKVILEDVKGDKDRFRVVLPMTKEEVDKGIHSKVIDSARWLAEWCIKMIKMFHGKVAYRRK